MLVVFAGDGKWGTAEPQCTNCFERNEDIAYAFFSDGRWLWYEWDWLYRFKNPHEFRIFNECETDSLHCTDGAEDIVETHCKFVVAKLAVAYEKLLPKNLMKRHALMPDSVHEGEKSEDAGEDGTSGYGPLIDIVMPCAGCDWIQIRQGWHSTDPPFVHRNTASGCRSCFLHLCELCYPLHKCELFDFSRRSRPITIENRTPRSYSGSPSSFLWDYFAGEVSLDGTAPDPLQS